MNGEHGEIYKQINTNHKETIAHIMNIKEDVSSIKTSIKTISELCSAHDSKIETIENKLSEARGGVAVFGFLTLVIGLVVALKSIGIF